MLDFFKVSKWFLLAAVFAVVLVSGKTLFPFIVLKYSFFRFMVDAAVIAFGLGIFLRKELFVSGYRERMRALLRSPLFLSLGAFLFIVVLAGIFAVDAGTAIWSNFERGEGVVQFIHLFAFFALLATLFRDEKEWRMIFKASLAAGALIVLYGIFAGLGFRSFIGPAFAEGVRFQGSLGNAAYVGVYFLFALFYSLYLSITSRAKHFLFLVAGASALIIFLAQTRGPFFGLAAGVLAFLAMLIVRSTAWRKRALIALVILTLFGGSLFLFHDTPFVKSLPSARLFNAGFTTSSWESRLWVWHAAFEGFKERPLLGWGPENFSFVFDKYFDTRHYVPNVPSDTWYDRAHNVFVDYLVTTGALGLIAFLSIFFFAFAAVRRARDYFSRQWGGNEQKSFFAQALLVSILIAYLMQGIVLFDILPTYINLFLLLAFIAHLSLPQVPAAQKSAPRQSEQSNSFAPSLVAGACIVLFSFFAYLGAILPYRKASNYITFLRGAYEQRTIGSFVDSASALFSSFSPVGQPETLRFFGNELVGVVQNKSVPVEAARYLVDFLEQQFSSFTESNGAYATMTQQYLTNGQLRLVLASREGKKEDSDRAEYFFKKCLELSPNRPQCMTDLYRTYMVAGDAENAKKLKEAILSFWPTETAVEEPIRE